MNSAQIGRGQFERSFSIEQLLKDHALSDFELEVVLVEGEHLFVFERATKGLPSLWRLDVFSDCSIETGQVLPDSDVDVGRIGFVSDAEGVELRILSFDRLGKQF